MTEPSIELPAEDTVGPFLAAELRLLDAKVQEAAPRVLGAPDAEAVHDLRVAIRRTRTLLEVGREVFGRFRADEVRRALRDVHRATGALRDEEVLLELIESLKVERPDVRSWIEARHRRERRLRTALRRKIRSGEIDRGRELLGALLAFRVKPCRERRLSKFARRAVETARADIERMGRPAHDDVEGLHLLRIRYKRLRYTVETFATALPEDIQALAPMASRFQSRLGDVHDADVGLLCVQQARLLTDAAKTALFDALRKARQERIEAYARLVAHHDVPKPSLHAVGAASLRKISTR
jgi:CHAD domain-containing protein